MVLSSREAPTILLGDSSGSWIEVAHDSVVRKSFLKGVEANRLGLLVNPNSRRDEILICGKGFVRSVIWEDLDFKVTEQFNSVDQSGDLFTPQWLDLDGDSKDELCLILKVIGRYFPTWVSKVDLNREKSKYDQAPTFSSSSVRENGKLSIDGRKWFSNSR